MGQTICASRSKESSKKVRPIEPETKDKVFRVILKAVGADSKTPPAPVFIKRAIDIFIKSSDDKDYVTAFWSLVFIRDYLQQEKQERLCSLVIERYKEILERVMKQDRPDTQQVMCGLLWTIFTGKDQVVGDDVIKFLLHVLKNNSEPQTVHQVCGALKNINANSPDVIGRSKIIVKVVGALDKTYQNIHVTKEGLAFLVAVSLQETNRGRIIGIDDKKGPILLDNIITHYKEDLVILNMCSILIKNLGSHEDVKQKILNIQYLNQHDVPTGLLKVLKDIFFKYKDTEVEGEEKENEEEEEEKKKEGEDDDEEKKDASIPLTRTDNKTKKNDYDAFFLYSTAAIYEVTEYVENIDHLKVIYNLLSQPNSLDIFFDVLRKYRSYLDITENCVGVIYNFCGLICSKSFSTVEEKFNKGEGGNSPMKDDFLRVLGENFKTILKITSRPQSEELAPILNLCYEIMSLILGYCKSSIKNTPIADKFKDMIVNSKGFFSQIFNLFKMFESDDKKLPLLTACAKVLANTFENYSLEEESDSDRIRDIINLVYLPFLTAKAAGTFVDTLTDSYKQYAYRLKHRIAIIEVFIGIAPILTRYKETVAREYTERQKAAAGDKAGAKSEKAKKKLTKYLKDIIRTTNTNDLDYECPAGDIKHQFHVHCRKCDLQWRCRDDCLESHKSKHNKFCLQYQKFTDMKKQLMITIAKDKSGESVIKELSNEKKASEPPPKPNKYVEMREKAKKVAPKSNKKPVNSLNQAFKKGFPVL